MRFKAKPKLTPEKLLSRLKDKPSEEFSYSGGISIDGPAAFTSDDILKLVREINSVCGFTPPPIDTHCDADFY